MANAIDTMVMYSYRVTEMHDCALPFFIITSVSREVSLYIFWIHLVSRIGIFSAPVKSQRIIPFSIYRTRGRVVRTPSPPPIAKFCPSMIEIP